MIKGISSGIFFVIVLCLLVSCDGGPKPINYGTDGCHYCSMTIVDNQHAAQFATKKGRAYKFDAIECMMNHLKDVDPATVSVLLVNDYNTPGELIDAKTAHYLVSKEIPSPMGEFLSAFDSEKGIKNVLEKHPGEQFSWEELKKKFKLH
ncbi:MAG: nitrous oxide reductase accessory protein NosL [Flavobacteriaceae bacterium]